MGDIWGGGLIVAAAAMLWLVYLIPTWLRRREYLATERNAVRLQQTLRILAETAEVPQQVRLEANARTVAEQKRLLRQHEARLAAEAKLRAIESESAVREAVAKVEAAAAAHAAISEDRLFVVSEGLPASNEAAGVVAHAPGVSHRRRVRAATSFVLLVSLVVIGLGAALFGAGPGAVDAAWLLLSGGGIVAAGSVVVLARLARPVVRTAFAPIVSDPPVATELYDHAEIEMVSEPAEQITWTPRPLPKPLYLSRGTIAASAMASVDAAADLRRAAARAELAHRAAQLAPQPTPISAVAARTETLPLPGGGSFEGVSSRFASMGIVAETGAGAIDLDAALRRRRAAS